MTDAVAAPAAAPEGVPVTPPAPAPAAPAAPVQLPVEQVVTPPAPAAPVVDAPPGDGPIAYEPTGDAGLDVALSFLGNLGIGMDNPGMKAAIDGDFGLLKAHLATLGDKARGWEQMLALAEDAKARATEKANTQAAAVTSAVHTIAGGADEWAKVQAWAAGEATPAEKAEINALFDSGVMGARAAAKLLVDQYRAAKGTVINPRSATQNTAGASQAPATSGPLSPREYHAAVTELRTKLGNRMDASPEYAALRARLRR